MHTRKKSNTLKTSLRLLKSKTSNWKPRKKCWWWSKITTCKWEIINKWIQILLLDMSSRLLTWDPKCKLWKVPPQLLDKEMPILNGLYIISSIIISKQDLNSFTESWTGLTLQTNYWTKIKDRSNLVYKDSFLKSSQIQIFMKKRILRIISLFRRLRYKKFLKMCTFQLSALRSTQSCTVDMIWPSTNSMLS